MVMGSPIRLLLIGGALIKMSNTFNQNETYFGFFLLPDKGLLNKWIIIFCFVVVVCGFAVVG